MRMLGVGKQRIGRTKRRFRGVDERSLRTCALDFSYPSHFDVS